MDDKIHIIEILPTFCVMVPALLLTQSVTLSSKPQESAMTPYRTHYMYDKVRISIDVHFLDFTKPSRLHLTDIVRNPSVRVDIRKNWTRSLDEPARSGLKSYPGILSECEYGDWSLVFLKKPAISGVWGQHEKLYLQPDLFSRSWMSQ